MVHALIRPNKLLKCKVMIEIIAAVSRWSQLAANLIVLGSCLFFALIGKDRAIFNASWLLRMEKVFPWLALIVLIGLVGILATATSAATGLLANLWNPQAWLDILINTQIGHIWLARAISATLLLITLLI